MKRPGRIPAGLQDILRPLFPALDLSSIRLSVGKPFFLRQGFDGMALGRRIWAPGDFYDRTPREQLSFLAHELTHVEQYHELGFIGFLRGYIAEYRAHRRQGLSRTEAYHRISFETQARNRSERVMERVEGAGSARG
ncbi:MAG TPA: hypothetical protein VFO06_07815 [Gemmatimonadales bacterium]|nr:hypothetical protein [Gemmatimonadales bacterium]